VGYGYDAFGEYASYNSVRDQVISLPALRLYERENKTSCIVDDLAPDMATTILKEMTVSNYSNRSPPMPDWDWM